MPSLRSTSWLVLFFASAFTFAGCAGDTTAGESGSLSLDLVLADGIVINTVSWEVSRGDMEPMSGAINTSAPGSTASVEVFGIPPGDDYLVELEATSEDGEVTCRGSAPFDVEVGVSTDVMVILNCKLPQRFGAVRVNGKFNICAELLKMVVAPLQTSVGNDIDLLSIAQDEDGDAISYTWSATGGSIADPSAPSTTYTCQEVGEFEVTVSVSDNDVYCNMATWTVPITCVKGEGPECTVDADCATGEICVDNVCVPDLECTVDADCATGEICVDNVCVPDLECVVDGDCATGEICVDNVCVPDLECIVDGDCATGEICVDNVCVLDVECIEDVDCVETNQCKMGVCDVGVCGSVDLADGTVCNLPDVGDAECRLGECVPVNVTLGDEFVLVFQENLGPPTLSLFLSGPVATSGEVSIGNGFSESFTVVPGEVTTVILPPGSEITTSDVVEPNVAVRITSAAPIAAYGLNRRSATTDAFAGLPALSLGQRYRVMSWPGPPFGLSQLAIAAISGPDSNPNAPTTVTITPSADSGTRLAGVPYTIEMNPFDAYQLQSSGDLTGTLIESSRPVAVFGSNKCANVPNTSVTFCDHLVEQMPPVSTWGTEALTVPLATRIGGDTFRIMADQDGTTVQLDGAAPESFVLGAGEFAQRLLDGSYRISADAPILVAQYSNSTSFDRVTSDPFMMLIPSSQQFLDSYTFATPGTGFPDNYANIVALTTDAAAGNVLLDGAPVPAENFTALTGTSFSVTQAPIAVGTHTVSAPNPVGLYVYGFANVDSYGYPGGFSAGNP